jgi:hypothetical protein
VVVGDGGVCGVGEVVVVDGWGVDGMEEVVGVWLVMAYAGEVE